MRIVHQYSYLRLCIFLRNSKTLKRKENTPSINCRLIVKDQDLC